MKTLLSRIFIFLLLMGFSTCDEPEKPKPQIETVTPTQGVIGDAVALSGKNFTSATAVMFGSISSDIVTKTDTEILTVVPAGSLPGSTVVSIKTDKQTSNEVAFTVLENVPEITSIEPSKASSGMEITVKGKYFGSITAVSFGSTQVTTFVSKNDAEAKVVVPAGLALGALDVTVTTGGGTSEKSTFIVFGKPEVTSITPVIGPVGKVVTIKGTNFDEVSGVFFGNGSAQFTVKSLIEIEATVPASATTGKVKVVTPGGEALSADNYTVKDIPQITSFTPASGVVGINVTINGSNFDAPNLVVKFGTGTALTITLDNAGKITAKVPASATTGKITVTTAAGSATSATNFTVIGAPTITSFTPASGLVGTQVTINGTNFIGVTEVKFNETLVVPANYTVVSETQIKANVPTGTTSGKISVKAAGGTALSASSFTVSVPPAITSFSPDKGQRNSDVVINGTAFSDITSVKIGGVELGSANYTVNSTIKITAKVTAAAITGKISVGNAVGTATSVNTFSVYPYIDAFDKTTLAAGNELTITGTNLGGSKVYFNTTEVTPSSNTATQIKVNVPINTGAYNVSVANSVGTSNIKTLTVTSPIVLTELIVPSNIKGTLIMLSGSNLTGATKVWFGTTSANVLTSTAKIVTAIIPNSLTVGSYNVKVETPNGYSDIKPFSLVNTQPTPPSGLTLVNGVPVAGLPGGYVPPVSNQWTNTSAPSEKVQLNDESNGKLSAFISGDGFPDEPNGTYDKINNYIEFTMRGVHYIGMWTTPTNYNAGAGVYCLNHLVLISTQSGKQLILEVENFSCP